MHALNGNSMTKKHKKENNKESPSSISTVPNGEVTMPSRIENCAELVSTPAENSIKHDPASDIEISKPWSSWEELLKIASEYKLLRYAPTEIARMKTNLRKFSPTINTKLLEMGAVALCGIFLNDYPVITAA